MQKQKKISDLKNQCEHINLSVVELKKNDVNALIVK